MKKLILLSLISLTLNSYCAEIDPDNEEILKPFTVHGTIIYEKIMNGQYYIKTDGGLYDPTNIEEYFGNNLKEGMRGKFVLKNNLKMASGNMKGTIVDIISFESDSSSKQSEWESKSASQSEEEQTSSFDLKSLLSSCSIQ